MRITPKFNNLQERLAFKRREHEQLQKQIEIITEADASISAFVWYCIPALVLAVLILITLGVAR